MAQKHGNSRMYVYSIAGGTLQHNLLALQSRCVALQLAKLRGTSYGREYQSIVRGLLSSRSSDAAATTCWSNPSSPQLLDLFNYLAAARFRTYKELPSTAAPPTYLLTLIRPAELQWRDVLPRRRNKDVSGSTVNRIELNRTELYPSTTVLLLFSCHVIVDGLKGAEWAGLRRHDIEMKYSNRAI